MHYKNTVYETYPYRKKHRQSCTGTDEQLVTNEQLFKNIFHWFYILKEQRD